MTNATPVCHYCDWFGPLTSRPVAIRQSERHSIAEHAGERVYAPIEREGANRIERWAV
jgi:hypothetical protein